MVLQRTFDGYLGFHDMLAVVQDINNMGSKYHVLAGSCHILLHQVFVVLLVHSPGFLGVGCRNDMDAFKHIHQESLTVHHNGVDAVALLFGKVERIVYLIRIGNFKACLSVRAFTKFGCERKFLRVCSEKVVNLLPQLYLQLMVSHEARLYLRPFQDVHHFGPLGPTLFRDSR